MELRGRSIYSGMPVIVTVEGEIIKSVSEISGDISDGELPYISPGFLDIQVNGYKGFNYSRNDFGEKEIESLVRALAQTGTTGHVPTLCTAPAECFTGSLGIIRKAMENNPVINAAIPGFHLEGPFISSEDGPVGAHDKSYVIDPDIDIFAEWQDAAGGLIKYITLAPERKGAIDFIREVVKTGVKVSIGHTGASPECIREAVGAGASCSTHLGNGSHAMIPRHRNYIWEQMAGDALMAGVISDGFHLPAALVKVIYRAKGPERIILVSDAAEMGGCKPGLYKSGNIDIEVFPDGHLGLAGTQALAGAGHLLDWDIARFMEYTGASLKETIMLCTFQPAWFLGLDAEVYKDFTPGGKADLVLFNYNSVYKKLEILKTLISGRTLFDVKPQ
ncbi:MAG: amidohydrolase family protein [Treponema sp.]|jgi:N-acetylglucosamine-6-phosphate deacetylase|nr:amidohydrolase family protein [Treponema sp.]